MEERTCRICGCTEDNACEGGCSWVEEDLCSACVDAEDDLIVNEDDESTDEISKSIIQNEDVDWKSADAKLKSEYEKFDGSGKEKAVSKHVLEALLMFCKDVNFAKAVENNKKSLTDCINAIMSGVGNSISDLEVYQKAASFYFPKTKINFVMTIDTDGLSIPVLSKEVIADMPKKHTHGRQATEVASEAPKETVSKKIVINLDGLV